MARHPIKDEEKMDSNRLHEERKAKIEAINKEAAEDKEIRDYKGLPREGETRDQLLDRIRKMRDEKPPVVTGPVFRSEGLQKEYDAEVAAGQAAVAKVAAEAEHYRMLLQKAEAEAQGEKNPTGRESGSK
jgi:hypothetical protein